MVLCLEEWGRSGDRVFFSKPKHMTSCWGRRNPKNLFIFIEKWVPGLELHITDGFVACLPVPCLIHSKVICEAQQEQNHVFLGKFPSQAR